jgi:hypothetical protein
MGLKAFRAESGGPRTGSHVQSELRSMGWKNIGIGWFRYWQKFR